MFQNNAIDINTLPDIEKVTLIPVRKKLNEVLIVEWLIFWGILIVVGTILIFNVFTTLNFTLQLVLTGVLFAFAFTVRLIGYFSFKITSYCIREHDIIYRSGWPVQKTTTVPFSRIQDSKVIVDFVAKQYGLAKLEVNTANNQGDISLRGLTIDEAEKINQIILDKINDERRFTA